MTPDRFPATYRIEKIIKTKVSRNQTDVFIHWKTRNCGCLFVIQLCEVHTMYIHMYVCVNVSRLEAATNPNNWMTLPNTKRGTRKQLLLFTTLSMCVCICWLMSTHFRSANSRVIKMQHKQFYHLRYYPSAQTPLWVLRNAVAASSNCTCVFVFSSCTVFLYRQ